METVMQDIVIARPDPSSLVAEAEGMSSQTRWHADVVDLLALVRYVAQHPEWINLLEPN
jgi:colicin import membrane protein